MDEDVINTAALLALNKSRIWTDCGGSKDQTDRIHDFLTELKDLVELELACRNPNVLTTSRAARAQEPFDWDPHNNHAEALLKLDLKAILTGSIKACRERDVLIFISQAFVMFRQLQNVGTSSGKRLRTNKDILRLLAPQDPAKRTRHQQQPGTRKRSAPRSAAKATADPASGALVGEDTRCRTTQPSPRGDENAARKPAALKDAPPISQTARKSRARKPTVPRAKPPPTVPLQTPPAHGKSRPVASSQPPPSGTAKTSRDGTGQQNALTEDEMKRLLASCRHKLVKSRVAKTFEDGLDYHGCVVSVGRNIDPPHEILFRVLFDDDDKEDFDAAELIDALRHRAVPETDRASSEENAKWVEGQVLERPVQWSIPGSEKFGNDMEIVAVIESEKKRLRR